MTETRVVQILGSFVGTAKPHPDGFRFDSLDVRLDELDGGVWPTLPELHLGVESAFRVSRARPVAETPR
jgi:hypothetical protein